MGNAYSEREKGISPEQELYRLFQETGQERLRLQAALDGFLGSFAGSTCSEEHKAAYRTYLKRRIRPAVQTLMQEGRSAQIKCLMNEGILDRDQLKAQMMIMADEISPYDWIILTGLIGRSQGETDDRKPAPEQKPAVERSEYSVNIDAPDVETRAISILRKNRTDLYALFPYLDGVMAALPFEKSEKIQTIATDGNKIFYHPGWIVSMREKEAVSLRRGLLHIMLHCIYLHIIISAGEKDRELTDRAVDLSVEQIIERECRSNPKAARMLRRTGMRLPDWMDTSRVMSVSEIMERLVTEEGDWQFDDHSLWKREQTDRKSRKELENKWRIVSRQSGSGQGGAGDRMGSGSEDASDSETLDNIESSRRSYRNFLRQFVTWTEKQELDTESFDYIYYTVGMEQCARTPLLEPLEYREGTQIKDLFIAIDTSGSCSAQTVRRFLEETYAMLMQSRDFFRNMKICLIQCDCFVRNVTWISSEQEWKNYLKDLVIEGRTGTDFCPVFKYIKQLEDTRKVKKPAGLIYFTDGDGVYPDEIPKYPTAFVFIEETKAFDMVPGWISKLVCKT